MTDRTTLDRRQFVRMSGMGLAGLCGAGFPAIADRGSEDPRDGRRYAALPETTAARPNILLFLVDDLGWQDLSEPFDVRRSPFNDRYRTPNVERLAKEGVKFTQAYACAVCSPTRISLMTGMNAARHRVTNWTLRRNQSTDGAHPTLAFPEWNVNGLSPAPGIERTVHATPLPAVLRSAGYTTIHCGKAHLGAIGTPGQDPLALGFDVNIAGHAAGGPGSHLGIYDFSADWRQGDRVWDVPGLDAYHGRDVFLTQALTERAIAALDAPIAARRPFFLYMSHYAVHTPIEADDRFLKRYLDAGLNPIEARYASMVEGMDRSLGDLMACLERKGVAGNTVVVFMSDNGGLSATGRGGEPNTHNRPLSSGKGSAHEGGIREPMIVRWPGVTRPGSVETTPVIIEDFFTTLAEMAGSGRPRVVQTIDGVSLVPLLRGTGGFPRDRPLFWHFPNEWGPKGPGIGASSTVRLGDWKLIYYHADRRVELFDLAHDLGETTNLADRHPDRVRSLAKRLTEHLTSVGAQMPTDKTTGRAVPWPSEAAAVTR